MSETNNTQSQQSGNNNPTPAPQQPSNVPTPNPTVIEKGDKGD